MVPASEGRTVSLGKIIFAAFPHCMILDEGQHQVISQEWQEHSPKASLSKRTQRQENANNDLLRGKLEQQESVKVDAQNHQSDKEPDRPAAVTGK